MRCFDLAHGSEGFEGDLRAARLRPLMSGPASSSLSPGIFPAFFLFHHAAADELARRLARWIAIVNELELMVYCQVSHRCFGIE